MGNSKEAKQLLARFGVTDNAIPRTPLNHPELPSFFVALMEPDPSRLQRNVRLALSHLQVPGLRTVVSAGYDLIYGLAEDSSKPRVVRGGWTPDGSDFSMLNPANHPLVDLPEEKKSRLYMDVILTRNDANNFLFHLCMVPQMPANDSVACSAHKLLHWMGSLMKEATEANGDLPPSSLAFDGGTKNAMLNKVLLGCVLPKDLKEFPFWNKCSFESVPVPLFPFKLAKLEGKHPVVGSNGPWHITKRFSLHGLSGARKIWWGSVGVDYACSLLGGMSTKAFCCADPQSDRQAALRLNIGSFKKDWDDWGVRLHALVAGLFQSGWTSASVFTQEQQQHNLFSCYFLVLLNVMHQQSKGGRWEDRFLPAQTVKNVLALCGHGILGNLMDAGFPDLRTEIPIERGFSEVKRPYRGMPTTKDCILGTHLHHLRQLRSLHKKPSPIKPVSPPRKPLTMARAEVLANDALSAACEFQRCITLRDTTAKELWQ